ncbi:AAA family ATPase [Enhygromyxa salina]|uniref:Orc1-like AAA ATPase domain-containing protein n=1 Tax=Enhygromyxa salina TaxID=215803 RepID=A0A2S9YN55_9BACT|nr:AAA family ATPase [Enhygromyxa salina]PRQ06502.1 hypothetical protein ENSA7_38210 [Enhygromyxa salina]
MNELRSSPYSPRRLAPAQLEALTVGRAPLLRHLEHSIVGAVASRQARFDLLIGPRGSGKSHMLGVLEHRLRGSAQLADRTLVVAPPEQLHPTSLVQLLAVLLREFPDDPDVGPVAPALESLRRQTDGDQERRAVALIRARLAGRSMIVVLEHLDDLFNALGRLGQQRLRNILQTERSWSILAGASSLLPSFTKHEAPFHGTFNIQRLEPLSAAHCRELLVALANAHEQPERVAELMSPIGLARVKALRLLLGGSPRAMALAFERLGGPGGRAVDLGSALAGLAEQQTPYVREQLARISPAQRNIMELLAEHWRPLSVGEIAERTFSTHGSTSGSIRHLRGDGLVVQLELGRERFYELADPLHRIAWAGEPKQRELEQFTGVVSEWFSDPHDPGPMPSVYALSGRPGGGASIARDAGAPAPTTQPQASSADPATRLRAALERALAGGDAQRELVGDIDEAWHARALGPVRSSGLDASSALSGVAEPARQVLVRAWCCAVFDHANVESEPRTESTAAAWVLESINASAPTWPVGATQPATRHLLACLTLQVLCIAASLQPGSAPLPNAWRDPGFITAMRLGVYAWLAARRPLAPLARLGQLVHEQLGVELFEPELLRCKSARHAVARLAGPERELIRMRLIRLRDTDGLAHFGFDAAPT